MARELTDQEKAEFFLHVHEGDSIVEPWDRGVATIIAHSEKLELDDAQWEVVSFLRRHFETTGMLDYARDLSVVLDQRFKSKGGLKYLYTLFPRGPVTQGSIIAGVPAPKDSQDNAFGFSA